METKLQGIADETIASGTEAGVQFSVYHGGREVANIVAGAANPESGRPVKVDTLFPVVSTGKGVLSSLIHALVQSNEVAFDTKIGDVWPEFAMTGKENVTIAHALTHAAGVPGLSTDVTVSALADTDAICSSIASQAPWWEPGTKTGYHPITFMYILERIVTGATGLDIADALTKYVTAPIGVEREVYFGVPESELDRVGKVVDVDFDPAEADFDMSEFPMFQVRDGFTPAPLAAMPGAAMSNDPVNLQSPGASSTASARGLAKVYASLISEVDGFSILQAADRHLLTDVAVEGMDEILAMPVQRSLGFNIGRPTPGSEIDPTVFGMGGTNGSAAYADAGLGLAVAVTKTTFTMGDFSLFERVFDAARDEVK